MARAQVSAQRRSRTRQQARRQARSPFRQPTIQSPIPKAVVTCGNARFTVLTPQLIRMEWSADGKFEDHASFVFINRRLPVPKFEATFLGRSGRWAPPRVQRAQLGTRCANS